MNPVNRVKNTSENLKGVRGLFPVVGFSGGKPYILVNRRIRVVYFESSNTFNTYRQKEGSKLGSNLKYIELVRNLLSEI